MSSIGMDRASGGTLSRLYRFYFHYNKQAKRMTVHFRGKCIPAEKLCCVAMCNSHRNKRQPYVVMRGFSTAVKIIGKDTVIIV